MRSIHGLLALGAVLTLTLGCGVSQAKYDKLQERLKQLKLEAMGEGMTKCGDAQDKVRRLESEVEDLKKKLAAKSGGDASPVASRPPPARTDAPPPARREGGDARPVARRPPPDSPPRRATTPPWGGEVGDGLDERVVRVRIMRARGRFDRCFKKARRKKPNLSGKVVVTFTVNKRGKARKVKVVKAKSTIKDRRFQKCVRRAMGKVKFTKPEKGKSAKVTFRLAF